MFPQFSTKTLCNPREKEWDIECPSLEIDIWGGLITSPLHFLMDPDFSVWFCDEYFQCWRQSWQNSCYCRCRSCVMRALQHCSWGSPILTLTTLKSNKRSSQWKCWKNGLMQHILPWQLVVGFNCSILNAYISITSLVGSFVTGKTLVGTLSMYKDVKIGELAGWRYWCSPRLMSRGVQPPINRNVYATFC